LRGLGVDVAGHPATGYRLKSVPDLLLPEILGPLPVSYTHLDVYKRQEIKRPQEEYDITLNMLKLEINKPLRDDQFALEQPPGAEVVHLDHQQSSAAAPPSSSTSNKR